MKRTVNRPARAPRSPDAALHVADGSGGLRPVADHRFGERPWAFDFVIPATEASDWMNHLTAEVEERNWSWSGLSQLDSSANSGSLTLNAHSGQSPPSLEIVWQKLRGKELHVFARTGGEPELDLATAESVLKATEERARRRTTIRNHQRAVLSYHGLPWRGELWLDAATRLGPPSRFPEGLLGPQNILVDMMVDGIGHQGVFANFQRRLQELRIFLAILLGINARPARSEYVWATTIDFTNGQTTFAVVSLGYSESNWPPEFPKPGLSESIERRSFVRPSLGPYGITSDMHECWVPADAESLWRQFNDLSPAQKEQLLHAGNAYSIAQSLWPEQRTAYAAFLVVACEALKPAARRYDELNVYDVVASLFSPEEAAALRHAYALHPQGVRSAHVHRGRLEAGELQPLLLSNFFADPSFDEMLRRLTSTARVCLIEWLSRKGVYKVYRLPRTPRVSKSRSSARRKRKNAT